MSANSLCFNSLYDARKSGAIELEAFLTHIVAHYGGLRHDEDTEGKRPFIYRSFETEVRNLVLSENFRPLDDNDTAIVYSIFLNGFQGNAAVVRKLIESFNKGSEYYVRPLMEISTAEGGNPELLRICFENGFLGTGYNESNHLLRSRTRNNPSTAWLDVLFDFDFRQWRTNPQQLCERQSWYYLIRMGADCTRWWIEHGGRTARARELFVDVDGWLGWPGRSTFRILLDQFGVDWFNDSGTLQLAVKNHDFETVQMLVEAGADVNEDVRDWQMDIREYRAAPLSALHEAVYAKSETMIRYLAEHGAKLEHKYVYLHTTSPVREDCKPFLDLVVELGAVKEETSL